MTRSKKTAFFLLMAVWFAIIASYTAYKEYSLHFGKSVMLKVVPVDPRDLFRGDYVILRYEISTLKHKDIIETVYIGETVYIMLEPEGKYYRSCAILKERPKEGTFIKGNIKDIDESNINIYYGIESFFVPENQGWHIESAGIKDEVAVEIMLNSYGDAVIKNIYINGQKVDLKNEKDY